MMPTLKGVKMMPTFNEIAKNNFETKYAKAVKSPVKTGWFRGIDGFEFTEVLTKYGKTVLSPTQKKIHHIAYYKIC